MHHELTGESPERARMSGNRIAEGKGCHREVGSERSRRQTPDPRYTGRPRPGRRLSEARPRRVSQRLMAKPDKTSVGAVGTQEGCMGGKVMGLPS